MKTKLGTLVIVVLLVCFSFSLLFRSSSQVQADQPSSDLRQQIELQNRRIELLEFNLAVLSEKVYARDSGRIVTISVPNATSKKYITFGYGEPKVAFYPDSIFGGVTFEKLGVQEAIAKMYDENGKLLDSYSVPNLTAGQLVIAWWADPLSNEFPSAPLPMKYPACYWSKVTGIAISVMNFDDSGPNVC